MNAVRKFTIELAEELATDVDAAVESGAYASSSEVIRDALRHWKRERETEATKLAELRRLVQEGLDSGPWIEGNFDVEDTVRRGRARLAASRTAASCTTPAISRQP